MLALHASAKSAQLAVAFPGSLHRAAAVTRKRRRISSSKSWCSRTARSETRSAPWQRLCSSSNSGYHAPARQARAFLRLVCPTRTAHGKAPSARQQLPRSLRFSSLHRQRACRSNGRRCFSSTVLPCTRQAETSTHPSCQSRSATAASSPLPVAAQPSLRRRSAPAARRVAARSAVRLARRC